MHRQFPGALIMAVVMRRVDATSVADGNRSGWSKVGRVRQDGVGQKEKAAERVLPWTPPRDAEVPNFPFVCSGRGHYSVRTYYICTHPAVSVNGPIAMLN